MNKPWTTPERVQAERARLEASLDGWRRPLAHGVVHELDGELTVQRVNLDGEGVLSAAALAAVTGHRSGTAAVPLTPERLDQAIALLSPAEACADLPHPNLWTWRLLRREPLGRARLHAVFADRIDDPDPADPVVRAFLAALHRGRTEHPDGTTTLWRPVGPAELDLLRGADMRAWPPRLPDQPIFYPVLNAAYAETIAREWNVESAGSGFVTRFRVETAFARRYPTRQAGGAEHLELWIPATDVAELNARLHGPVEVVTSFP